MVINTFTHKLMLMSMRRPTYCNRYEIVGAQINGENYDIILHLNDPNDGIEKILHIPRHGLQSLRFLWRKIAIYCEMRNEPNSLGELPCLIGCALINDPLKPGFPFLKFQEKS